MDERKKADNGTARTDDETRSLDTGTTQRWASPMSDPTNPYNQEPTGDWVASARAAERSNNEPGLTDRDRKRRRW